MALEDWCDLDLSYLLLFGDHPDLSADSDTLSPMPVLLIATSPRGTWITAPDRTTADTLRTLLTGTFQEVRKREHTVDVGIGVEAMEAGDRLLAAGYTFAWHEDQHPADRTGTAWGIPVTEG